MGWPILRDYASAYVSCPDYVAANGMRLYAAARGGDAPIVSGESGAAPLGALDHIMRNPALAPLRESLGSAPIHASCSSAPKATPRPASGVTSAGTAGTVTSCVWASRDMRLGRGGEPF